ncbi:MAG: hypothetical protein ACRDRL_12525, partial [Sciscionella sp.]
MGSADDGVNGPAPDAGTGGNGQGSNGHGTSERSPWAAPVWDPDASFGPGERPSVGTGPAGDGPAAVQPSPDQPVHAQAPA